MLAKMTAVIADMRVFPERMKKNLDATQGLVFSGQLLQDLVEKGMSRDDAYKAVQENAMAAWESDTSFRDRVAAEDRKSTRLNSSHSQISYAVFCLKKKKKTNTSSIDKLARAP